MNVTRKTWVSAGIVSLVLAGGISVTAAAAAGGIERAWGTSDEPVPVAPHAPAPSSSRGGPPSQEPSPTAPPPPSESYVISEKVNPDPEKVVDYWTEHRMEEAEPFPMPMVEGPPDVIEDSSDVTE
ncbi:hypothetical protein [Streptosporangium amethystogenes]|uniref:hypothetical protein n=1 Tax=Streptosporangium amethystogenes TaxID=2002 RepID=UPI0004CA5802|nr:hypothetical protein [Streptosporangium amethystogenes]